MWRYYNKLHANLILGFQKTILIFQTIKVDLVDSIRHKLLVYLRLMKIIENILTYLLVVGSKMHPFKYNPVNFLISNVEVTVLNKIIWTTLHIDVIIK